MSEKKGPYTDLNCLRGDFPTHPIAPMVHKEWRELTFPTLPAFDQITTPDERKQALEAIAFNTKAERNTAFAKFGLEAWDYVLGLRASTADGIYAFGVSIIDEQDIQQPFMLNDLFDQRAQSLKLVTMQTVKEAVRTWDTDSEIATQGSPADPRNAVWTWVNNLYTLHQQLRGRNSGEEMNPAGEILATGFITAAHVMWDTLEVIPALLQANGLAVTEERLAALTRPESLQQFFLHIAAGSQGLINQFINMLCDAPVSNRLDSISRSFNPDYFTLMPVLNGKVVEEGTEGAEHILMIKGDFMERFMQERGNAIVENADPRYFITGCPAIFVQLIQTMYRDWVLPLAQKYYFPTVVETPHQETN